MSLSQKASAEFVRLLRERQGNLSAEDRESVVVLYMQAGMERVKVEQWLDYTLARMPAVQNVVAVRSAPVVSLPALEMPPIQLPDPNSLMQSVTSKLTQPRPTPVVPNDFKLPDM
jgi:hypothetical protein